MAEQEYQNTSGTLFQSKYTQVLMEIPTSGHVFNPHHQVALTIAVVQISLEDEMAMEKNQQVKNTSRFSRIFLTLLHQP